MVQAALQYFDSWKAHVSLDEMWSSTNGALATLTEAFAASLQMPLDVVDTGGVMPSPQQTRVAKELGRAWQALDDEHAVYTSQRCPKNSLSESYLAGLAQCVIDALDRTTTSSPS